MEVAAAAIYLIRSWPSFAYLFSSLISNLWIHASHAGVTAGGGGGAGGACPGRQCRRRRPARGEDAPQPRQVHGGGVEGGARHLLRRPRRVRRACRRVRLQGHGGGGVRPADGGGEHGAVQRRRRLRRVLRGAVRGQPRRVQGRGGAAGGDGDQPLPSQRPAVRRRRRLVQPAARALRPHHAGVPPDRQREGRHRAHLLPPGAVREAGRDPVHHHREQVLQPGDGDERGRRRRRGGGDGEGEQEGEVDAAEAQLGAAVADVGGPHRRVADLPRDDRRPPQGHLLARPPPRLAVRGHLPGHQELQVGARMHDASACLRLNPPSLQSICIYVRTTHWS